MVFESILNPKNAEKRPLDLFIITVIYTFLCIIFSTQLFGSTYSSVLTIALITIVFVPFFQRLFVLEEKKDERAARMKKCSNFLARHSKSLYVFSVFFLGIITTMSVVAVFMPSYTHVFELQHKTLSGMSGSIISGHASSPSEKFIMYFVNNSQVMILVFILSLAFGAGSIFILAWNASVIAVYASYFVQSFVVKGYETTLAFAQGIPIGLGSIALHGVPEMSAYFVGGLAGGILSVGVIREKTMNKEFKLVLKDSLYLLVLAELLILLAALLEAFI
jgi:uncharacterized membrane protein SpoIIM required for sporulation